MGGSYTLEWEWNCVLVTVGYIFALGEQRSLTVLLHKAAIQKMKEQLVTTEHIRSRTFLLFSPQARIVTKTKQCTLYNVHKQEKSNSVI